MRLYDDLCVIQPRPCFGDDPYVLEETFFESVVFDMQQVADYFFSLPQQDSETPGYTQVPVTKMEDGRVEIRTNDYFGFEWSDMGCLIPPYEEMFCEYRAPEHLKLHNERKGEIPVGRVGCWVSRIDKQELLHSDSGQSLLKILARHGVATEELGFFVDIRAFIDKPGNGGIIGPVVSWGLPLDETGELILDEKGQPRMVWKPPVSLYSYDDDAVIHFAQVLGTAVIVPALMGISIMHTPLEEEWHTRQRQDPPPNVSRKHARRYGRPLVSYYVLSIGGVKKRMSEGGHRTLGAVLQALHSVRGHRRYYTRSYFGRTTHKDGRPITPNDPLMVFVPEHMRGSAEAGRRDKDYEVVPDVPA